MRGRTRDDSLRPVRRSRAIGLLGLVIALAGCGSRQTSGLLDDSLGDAGIRDGSVFEDDFDPTKPPPPPPDASGYCGNDFIPTVANPPNLYFVIDRSGSMADVVDGQTKATSLEIAAVDLVRRLGARARIGAAVYPGYDGETSCGPGVEVFSATLGDPLSYVDSGKDGPVTLQFAAAIHATPFGGTPTGPTLEKLRPNLTALDGKTYVILATDGGPNCNPDAQCGALTCIPNIEELPGCSQTSRNCCTEETYGRVNCLDSTRTIRAVQRLREAGIVTYVIGLPGAEGDVGTEIYSWLLDEMAVAGGAAREGSPRYFAVDRMTELRGILASIGAEIIATCEYTLETAPKERNRVNVYFDTTVVPRDPVNGWDWTGPDSLTLRGEACDEVKSGSVGHVQIVVGCPTEEPK